MNLKAACAVLLVILNAVLVLSNFSLSAALKNLEMRAKLVDDTRFESEIKALLDERTSIGAERARLAQKVAALSDALRSGVTMDHKASSHGITDSGEADAIKEIPAAGPAADGARDLMSIPLLTDAECADLVARRDSLPDNRPSDHLLIQGDVAVILNDPLWNPEGRKLTLEERTQLEAMAQDYRFFARASIVQRSESFMKPEVERMAAAGAYVEYPLGDGPSGLPLVSANGIALMRVTTPADREGFRRMFFFYPEDYPDLYHQQRVEHQRQLESYVKAFELINEHSSKEHPER